MHLNIYYIYKLVVVGMQMFVTITRGKPTSDYDDDVE